MVGWQALGDILGNRCPPLDRGAHITAQEVAEIGQVLLVQRFIQAPFLAEGGDGFFVVKRIRRQVGVDGVGWDGVGDDERHDGDTQQQRDGEDNAAKEVLQEVHSLQQSTSG